MPDKSRFSPDAEVTLADGTAGKLSDYWKEQVLVLVFLRHFG